MIVRHLINCFECGQFCGKGSKIKFERYGEYMEYSDLVNALCLKCKNNLKLITEKEINE